MRRWVAAHPLCTSLLIRYDPRQPDYIVPASGVMPESEAQASDDLG